MAGELQGTKIIFMKGAVMTRKSLLFLAMGLLSGPVASLASTISFPAGPDGPGGQGSWDVVLTEISPTVWDFSVTADRSAIPNGNADFFELDLAGLPTAQGGAVTAIPPMSVVAGTSTSWTAALGYSYFYLEAGNASAIQADGTNTLSGTFTLKAPVPTPYLSIEAYPESTANGGIFWEGGTLVATAPVPLPSSTLLLLSGFGGFFAMAVTRRQEK
jgi:hypothetical protein